MLTTNRRLTTKSLMLAFAVALFLAGAGGATAHAAVTINCTVPLNVQCTVSEPQGIQSIKVQLQTGFGIVEVFDQTYPCVTSATVSWDPIVPGGEILVTTCGGLLPPRAARAYAQEPITYHLRDGVVQREPGGSLNLRRPGVNYVLRAPLRIVRTAQSRIAMQMLPLLDAFAPGSAEPAFLEATLCCDAGTMNNCFGVNLLAQCGEGLDFVHCYEDEENQQSVCESSSN